MTGRTSSERVSISAICGIVRSPTTSVLWLRVSCMVSGIPPIATSCRRAGFAPLTSRTLTLFSFRELVVARPPFRHQRVGTGIDDADLVRSVFAEVEKPAVARRHVVGQRSGRD